MGRAMLIICAGVLISMGFVSIGTNNTSRMITQQNVDYAEYTMAKNAAHTAVQMAMQNINKDEDWADDHTIGNPWRVTIQGLDVELYTELNPSADYWEPDEIRFVSKAQYKNSHVQVESFYLKQPFSEFVPDFVSALSFATTKDKFNFALGGSVNINGNAATGCTDGKPGITSIDGDEDTFSDIDGSSAEIMGDPDDVVTDPELSYEPTDEMIERLYNTIGEIGGAVNLSSQDGPLNKTSLSPYGCGDNSQGLGCSSNPGVFVVEDELKITGGKIEGFGILIVRSDADMIAVDETGAELDLAGNFEFNGLVVFENAVNFGSAGTPTINGSVLIGNTSDFTGTMNINMTGNGTIQYDCNGENYAKMAAAQAVQQNKYTQITSTENILYN